MTADRDVTHVLITPDDLQEHVRQAYLAGCCDVQENYRPLREGEDPEFGEASYDYVASLDFTETTQPGAPQHELDEAQAALAVVRQSLQDQAAARADPTMPRLTPEVLETLMGDAEAAYALAETQEERVAAHGLSLLCDWQANC